MMSNLSWSVRLLRRLRSAPARWVLVSILLGLVLTVGGMAAVAQHQRRIGHRERERHLDRRQQQLMARLKTCEDLLLAARSVMGDGRAPSPQRWKAFVDGLDLPNRHPGLGTLGVIERVPMGATATATSGMAKGWMAEAGRPGAPSPERLLVALAEPADPSLPPSGQELDLRTAQGEAALRAMSQGRPVLSAPFRLGAGPSARATVAFLLPLYRSETVPDTPGNRPRDCWGWVYAGVGLDDLLREAEGEAEPGRILEVWDSSTQGSQRLYPHPGNGDAAVPAFLRAFEIGGRTWMLALQPAAEGPGGRWHGALLGVMGAGLVFTFSLALALGSLAGARDRASRLAEQLSRTSRETLRRFEALVSQTPVGVVEWDARLRIRRWNPAAERIFGFPEDEVLDRSGSSIRLPGGSRDEVRASLEEVVREGRGLTRTLAGQRKDAEPVVCEWTTTPIYGLDGRMEGLISLVLDVTEQRRTEERLWLHQKLESLGVMAGGIAHDFNNLLWAISGNAELARDRVPPESPALINLERIETAAFRAAALARQLMIYTGRAPFVTRSIEPRRLLEEAQTLMASGLPVGVDLQVQVPADLPAVQADGPQLQQAIHNLLVNAVEATALQGGRVLLRAASVEADATLIEGLVPGSALPEGPAVVLEVIDAGAGIDPAYLPRIFDPFFSTKGVGRGLGLSAALGILRAHRGGLSVETEPGKGSRFRALLPAVPGPAEEVQPPGLPTAPLADAGRILLAEDEPVLRGLVVEALEPFGFQVAVAQGSNALLEQLAEGPYAAVVLDLRLSGERLEACLRGIRDVDAAVPVLLCTGSPGETSSLPVALKPAALLAKPYRLRELVALVQEHARKA